MSNELAFHLSGHETDQISARASNPDGDVHLLSGIASIYNLEIKNQPSMIIAFSWYTYKAIFYINL